MHNTIVNKNFSAIADKKNKMEKIQMETKAMIKGMAARRGGRNGMLYDFKITGQKKETA